VLIILLPKKGFEFTNIIEDGGIIFALGSNIAKEGDKVKVKISGIPNGGRVYFGTWITATEDGEYLGTYAYDDNGNTTIGTLGCIGATITLEFIPDYPDQLCYDGKMYAVAYDMPILTDYTVMADRTWFDKTGVRCFCSKYKDNTVAALFKFEWVAGNKEYTSSLGKDTNVVFVDSNITWQTKTSYNGKALTNLSYEDGEHLIIGDCAKKIGNYYIGCHDDIIILKRSLTINEINDITEAIFNETIIEE